MEDMTDDEKWHDLYDTLSGAIKKLKKLQNEPQVHASIYRSACLSDRERVLLVGVLEDRYIQLDRQRKKLPPTSQTAIIEMMNNIDKITAKVRKIYWLSKEISQP